jgi:hypothetical protein
VRPLYSPTTRASRQVKELNLGTYPAKTVSGREPSGLVFEKLEKTGLSGLGIVNDEGMIIGNISGRDLKVARARDECARAKLNTSFCEELCEATRSVKVEDVDCRFSQGAASRECRCRARRRACGVE